MPSGARIRGRFRIEDVEDVTSGKQARVAATIELEGQEKPACVAEALFRFLVSRNASRRIHAVGVATR